MANVAANAIVGKPAVAGGVSVANLGTTLPANESTQLGAAFASVGYLGDAGLTRTEKTDSDTKKAWGGDTLVVLDKGTTYTAKFVLAEYLNPVVQKLLYGDGNVTATAATSSAGNKLAIIGKQLGSLPHKVIAIQMFSGPAVGRILFPDAQITDRGDVVYKDDDIAAREVTLTLLPDASGNYFYEYWDDGRKTA